MRQIKAIKRVIVCVSAALFTFCLSASAFAAPLVESTLTLTEQEHEYFKQNKTLRVIISENYQPYIYTANGTHCGVSLDILKLLCKQADIQPEFVTASDSAQARLMLENKQADISVVEFNVSSSEQGFIPFLRAPVQLVYHENAFDDNSSQLSIAQLESLKFLYSSKYSFVMEKSFDSVHECLNAVRSRKADIFLCDTYQLSVYSDSFAARDLSVINLPEHEIYIGFGIGSAADSRLASALHRTVQAFTTSSLSSSLIAHKFHHSSGFNLTQFIYKHPFELLCAVSALFFVILLCLFVSFRVRSGQRQELHGYEESYRMLAETFGEAGMEYDFLNDRLTVFGNSSERLDLPEVTQETHSALLSGSIRLSLSPSELDTMLSNNAPGRSYETELQCGVKGGALNWYRMIYIVVCTSESHRRPIRLIGCLINIEQERREKELLLKTSSNDQLTELLNRAAAEKEIINALGKDNEQKVLLFIDIDYFKHFNDLYGHSCGDAVLKALSREMRKAFAPNAILGRWGGDEFLVLLRGPLTSKSSLTACLSGLQSAMRAFKFFNQPLAVTLSVGGAASTPNSTFSSLFETADIALYEVKNKERDSFKIVYPPALENAQATED